MTDRSQAPVISQRHPLKRRLGGNQNRPGRLGEEINIIPLLYENPSRTASSPVIILTTLSQLKR